TPESVHGRVMAADLLASNLALFLGLGAGGVLIGAIGLRPWILTLGTLVVVAGAALTFSDRAETRTARAARPAQPSADPLLAARRAPR
ncbi:MAG TPA: hypothetical protein VHD87_03180, partial [Acidimicrobiales bacterium]|nr:hypothetical protein [Acidimicrobiales bacterium]